MEDLSRALHGPRTARSQRALARGAERPPDLPPRNRPDGGRSDRLPLERADRVEGARHALVDHAEAPGAPRRRWPDHPPGQPQRQALCPQGQGRGGLAGLRLRPLPPGRASRRNRGARGGGHGRGASAPLRARADHARQARHRQDDRHRPRGGHSAAGDRAGGLDLGGSSRCLSRRGLSALDEQRPR